MRILKRAVFLTFFIFSLSAENVLAKTVLHIPPHSLQNMEDLVYFNFIQRAFAEAEKRKVDMIILEINTFGGEVDKATDISGIIRNSGIPSVCFVNHNAISAGSLIALSCDKLAMSKSSNIGAALPIQLGENGKYTAVDRKMITALANVFGGLAEGNDKNSRVAKAFVDPDLVLTKKKDGIDWNKPGPLSITSTQAVDINIADYIAFSKQEILKEENLEKAKIIIFKNSFAFELLGFLGHPAVAGILIGLGMIGLFFEIKSPGWGIPGTAGVLFISLYFIVRISLGASGWGAPALFALGIILILLEFFVIPGFGVAGFAGLFCIAGSILWGYGDVSQGLWVMASSLSAAVIMVAIFLRYLPQLAVAKGNKLFLNASLAEDEGAEPHSTRIFLGKNGIAKSDLRPAGIIDINGERIDAMTRGDYVEAGSKIQIVAIQGSVVVVEKKDKISDH